MATTKSVTISAPNFQTGCFRIRGTVPYVGNKFSEKAKQEIHDTQKGGAISKKGKKKSPKDFKACYEAAIHCSADGWAGIPASGLRAALVSACRMTGLKMTRAKLAVFVEQDGFDKTDSSPLVKIIKGKPKYFEVPVRLANGSIDLRARPMWEPGWEADVRIRFDADMLTIDDVTNLLYRVGQQVGIGEGRNDSKKSTGQGWGAFEIAKQEVMDV